MSVATIMLVFLEQIHDAVNKESSSEIVVFYIDFAMAFDKVPHLAFLQKLSQFGVGGCIPEMISDYLDQRRQFLRVDITSSQLLNVTSGVPQGSVLGPVMICRLLQNSVTNTCLRKI